MAQKIWFLTGNQGKVTEAQHHLANYDVQQLVVDEEIVEPQCDSLQEVAEAKIFQALEYLENEDDWILVEDAGLFVQALDGFPGVYSAYALKTIGCAGILRLLSHLQSEDPIQDSKLRQAEFQAVAALWSKDGIRFGFGTSPGQISQQSQGEGGFGFDPIFIPNDLDEQGNSLENGIIGHDSAHGKTFGEMSTGRKGDFSHRNRALQDLLRQL